MKSLYLILLACLFAFAFAQDYEDFDIQFFKKPNYQEEAGFISGSVKKGEGAGTPRGNMSVQSFQTQDWLQVTLFEKPYYGGASHVYTGSQSNINPAVQVRSVKWKHL